MSRPLATDLRPRIKLMNWSAENGGTFGGVLNKAESPISPRTGARVAFSPRQDGLRRLSITHKLSAHLEADLDIAQPRHASPHDHVSRRGRRRDG